MVIEIRSNSKTGGGIWWSCVAMLEFVESMGVEVSAGRTDIGATVTSFITK